VEKRPVGWSIVLGVCLIALRVWIRHVFF
jgi:hypothetical protein